jgi:glycosyltransferase involved in cell wall biosynthesis
MTKKIIVFDPTKKDTLSQVRGVGRYLQLLKENFPDWIFSNKLQVTSYKLQVFINPFFNFLQPPLTFKRLAKKQIAVLHDLIPLKYPDKFPAGIRGSFNIFLNKLVLKNYDLVVTDSFASKKDIIQILRLPEEKIKVIYPCLPKSFLKLKIENSKFNKNLKLKIENFVLYVGDATWNKNLVNLAKAIKIANVSCIFVGKVFGKKIENSNPWQKEFNEFIEITNDDKRFILKGFVTDYELVKLYQQAILNILVSRDEGFGFSYLEAANFGCPSVLSHIPVLKEVSAGQGAIFADPNDPEDIADKLKKLVSDENLRRELSLEAQKQAKDFNPKKFKNNFSSLLMIT